MGIVDENLDYNANQQPLLLDLSCLSSRIKTLSPLIDYLPGIAYNDAVFRAYWSYYASDNRRRPQVFRRRLENADLIKQIKVRNTDEKTASLLDVLARIEDGSADHEPITTVYNEFLKCFYQNLKGKPRKRTIVPDLKALNLKECELCTALKRARNPYDLEHLKDELDRIKQIRLIHHSSKMFHDTNQIQLVHPPSKINEGLSIKNPKNSLDAKSTDNIVCYDFSRNNATDLIRYNHLLGQQNKRQPISLHKDFSREVNGKKCTTRRNFSDQPSTMFQSEEHKHKTHNVHHKGENLHQIKQSSRKDPQTLNRHHDKTIPKKYDSSTILVSKILLNKTHGMKNPQESKRIKINQAHTDKAENMIPQKKNIHKSNPHKPKDDTSTSKKKKPTDKTKNIKHINALEQTHSLKEPNKAARRIRWKPSSSLFREPRKQKEEQEIALENIERTDFSNESRDQIEHHSNKSISQKPEIMLNKEDYKKLVDIQNNNELKEFVPEQKGSEVNTIKSEISQYGSKTYESDETTNNIPNTKSKTSLQLKTPTPNKQPKNIPFKFRDKKSVQMQYFYQTKRSSLYKNIVPIHRFIEELTRSKSIKKYQDSGLKADLPIEVLQNPKIKEALLTALIIHGLHNKVSLDDLLRHSDPNYKEKSVQNGVGSSNPEAERMKLLRDTPRRSTIGSQSSYSPTDSIEYKASRSKLDAYQDHASKLSITSMSSDTSHGRGMYIDNTKAPKQMSKRISQMVEEFIKEPNVQRIFEHLNPGMIKSSTSTSDSEDSSRLVSKPTIETKYDPCSICKQLQKHPSTLKPYMQQMDSQRKKMELGNYYRQMIISNCQQRRELEVQKRIERKWQHCPILKKLQNIVPVHNQYDYWKSSPFY